MRYLFVLVGMRERNLPNSFETLILCQEIDEEYGRHTMEEIKLAFRMAVHGKLSEANDKALIADHFENFSVMYFAKIMSAYKRWSNKVIPHVFKEEPVPVPSFHDVHAEWQKHVESEYQFFLQEKDHHQLWPEAFYDCLVYDELIEPFRFENEKQRARSELLGPMYKKVNELKTDLTIDTIVRYNKVMDVTKEINQVKAGMKDAVLQLQCKQISVLKFYQECQKKSRPHIYIFPEIQLSERDTHQIKNDTQ